MKNVCGLSPKEEIAVSTIVETYELLSPLSKTANRILRRVNGFNSPLDVDWGDAKEKKTYTFRSTYDSVEITVYDKVVTGRNTDGQAIRGRFTAHDSSIGSTRLFETWDAAASFAGARKSSQDYLNKVVGA